MKFRIVFKRLCGFFLHDIKYRGKCGEMSYIPNKKTYLNELFERCNNIYGFNENSNHTAINLSNIKLVLHIYRALIVMKIIGQVAHYAPRGEA